MIKISKRLKFLLKFMCIPIYVSIVIGILFYILGIEAQTIWSITSSFSIGCVAMLGWMTLIGFIVTTRKI